MNGYIVGMVHRDDDAQSRPQPTPPQSAAETGDAWWLPDSRDANDSRQPIVGAVSPLITPRPSIVNQGPGASPARRPEPLRPGLSLAAPAPVPLSIPAARSVRVAQGLWTTSFVLGAAAFFFALYDSGNRQERLRGTIAPLAPEWTEQSVHLIATLLFWGTVVLALLVVAAEIALLATVLRGRSWPRLPLVLVVLLLHVPAALGVFEFVAIDADGLVITVLAAAQWLLAAIGTTALLLPDAGDWFRAKREARTAADSSAR